MLEGLFVNTIKISAIMGVVILVLLALSPLLKRNYAAKWRYWVWMILAVRLLIPWSLSLPQAPVQLAIPKISLAESITPIQHIPAIPSEDAVQEQNTASNPTIPPAPAIHRLSFPQLAAILWLTGVFIFLLHQLIAYRLFRKRALHKGAVVHDRPTPEMLAQHCQEMGIKKSITIITGPHIQGPMMIGFIRPYLLLPHTDYTGKELHYILKHELTHLKRHDLWYKLLLLFANAMHWFNPLVWLMFHQASKNLEMSCDDEVTQGTSFQERKEYSKTILASIHCRQSGETVLSTYFHGGKNTMKERFQNILHMGRKRRGTFALCMVFMLVGIAGAFVACYEGNDMPATAAPNGASDIGTDLGNIPRTIIAALDKNQIELSAGMPQNGMYSPLILSIKGREHTFDWGTLDKPSFLPELNLLDIDGDDKNELLVILCQGEGTGVLVQEVHAINTEDFSEMPIEDPISVLDEQTTMDITDTDIQIKIANEPVIIFAADEVDSQIAERDHWFETPGIGSIVSYSVQDGRLTAEVAVQISPGGFLGAFTLIYAYQNDELAVDQIIFSGDIESLAEQNGTDDEYPETKDIAYESEGGQYTEAFTLLNTSLPFVTYIPMPETGWSAQRTDAGIMIKHNDNGYIEISFLQDGMGQQDAEAEFENVLGDISKFEKREENLPGWAISSLYLWENNSMTWATLGLHSGQYFYIYTHYPDSIEGDFPLIQSIFNEWRWRDTGEALGYSLQ